MASEEQYEAIYSFFRANYSQLSSDCLISFDKSLFNCMKIILNEDDFPEKLISIEIKELSKKLCEIIISFLQVYRNSLSIKYCNTFGFSQEIADFDSKSFIIKAISFVNKFCKAVKDNIDSDSLIEDFSSSFPVEDNKGKFHARLKTLCYMNLLQFTNMVAKSISEGNGKTCAIYCQNRNWSGTAAKEGVFTFPARKKDYSFVWEVKNGLAKGSFPPSHFGSREILVPKRKGQV